MAVGVGRVARSPVVAQVERQEPGLLTRQLGGHGHPVGVDGEVDEGTAREGDVGRVPVLAVLGDGVLDVLVGEWVLQFGGGGRDAVDEEGQVDGVVGVGVVGELAGDGDAVGGVEGREGRREAVCGLEVGELDRDAEVDDAVAEDVDRASVVEFCGEALGEAALSGVGVVAVATEEGLPFRGLGRADEGEQFGGVEAEDGVEVGGRGLEVAASVRRECSMASSKSRSLTLMLRDRGCRVRPVTAAVMRA